MLTLPPAFLCLPRTDHPVYPGLRRKLLLLALRRFLTHPLHDLPGPLRASLQQARPALTRAVRRHRSAVLAQLAHPDVLAPLLCLEADTHPAARLLSQAGPALLSRLALARLLDEGVIWQGEVSALSTPPGLWRGQARALAALPGHVELELADGSRRTLSELPRTASSFALGHGVELSLFDSNPLAMLEAHPDKQGNALDLGDHPVEQWVSALTDALSLVEIGLPEWIAELPLSLQRVVPVGYLPEVHLSASYREAPGLAYLTLHPSTLTLAEALVHETQHSRLNVLTWLDPVLDNGWTEWTDSPVRPDLRPLMGVLLAVHAFVPVAALHARLAHAGHPLAAGPDFDRRRTQVLAGNDHGLRILQARARPTAAGGRMLADLRRLHDNLLALAPTTALDDNALPPG